MPGKRQIVEKILGAVGVTVDGANPWDIRVNDARFYGRVLAQIGRSVEGMFVIEDVRNLSPHYDRTLMAWHDNFQVPGQAVGTLR